MKNQKNKNVKVLISLLVALILVGYKFIFPSSVTEEFSTNESDVAGERVSSFISEVNSVNFDLSVLNDSKFKNLKSIEKDLPTFPLGKDNPFSGSFAPR